MKFNLPTGFVLPDDVEPGQEFDAVVTLNLDDSGGVTVVAIDGSPIEDAEEADEAEEVATAADDADPDFLGAVAADLAGMPA